MRDPQEYGYVGTALVRSSPAKGYGRYEVAGNAWEWWCNAWSAGDASSLDGDVRVMRGGSHLCHDSYCNLCRVAADA